MADRRHDRPGDAELARRAGAGDREAFATLIARHYDRIFRVVARVLGDDDAAADVTQDVCIGLAARLGSWRGEAQFTTWLYRVAVNAAHDAIRRRVTRRRIERAGAEAEALRRAGDEARACEARWLREALDALGDDLRATVALVVEEGLKHAEAGAVLGVSEATVSWRMHEVRRRLRSLVLREREAGS